MRKGEVLMDIELRKIQLCQLDIALEIKEYTKNMI